MSVSTLSRSDPLVLRIDESPVSDKTLNQAIQKVREKSFHNLQLHASGLSTNQVRKLEDLVIDVKGTHVTDLDGGFIGGVHTNWSLYQTAALETTPTLRPSPAKAFELYRIEYGTFPKHMVDFGAGPGMNTIPALMEGVEKIDAIDCDPQAKIDFEKNLERVHLTDLGKRVNYITAEFDTWQPTTSCDILVSNYAWPWRRPENFMRCWQRCLDVVRPGGYLCGEFYTKPLKDYQTITYHTEEEVRLLVAKSCHLLWIDVVAKENSRSILDEASGNQELHWKTLIRIVARKNSQSSWCTIS